MWPVFWGFRVMSYASVLMFAAALIGVVLRLRKKPGQTHGQQGKNDQPGQRPREPALRNR
jgi:cytochrome bd-type quinol oxidase subunit 1